MHAVGGSGEQERVHARGRVRVRIEKSDDRLVRVMLCNTTLFKSPADSAEPESVVNLRCLQTQKEKN